MLSDDIHCDVYEHHETAMCLALALINAESDCYGYGVDAMDADKEEKKDINVLV